MKNWARKTVGILCTPTGLAGGFIGATFAALFPGSTGLPGLIVGWLYGVVVGALIRLIRTPPGAYPLTGLLAGPVPLALLMPVNRGQDKRGILFLGLVAGLILGCVEWAVARRAARERADGTFERLPRE